MGYRPSRPDHAAAANAPYAVKVHRHADAARVVVVSLRGPVQQVSRCLMYEFEDTIADLDAADIVGPTRTRAPSRCRHWLRRGWRRVAGFHQIEGTRQALPATGRGYDLMFLPLENIEDLFLFGDLRPWLECSRKRICWLVELWANNIQNHVGALELLRQFDAVAVGCQGSTAPLQEAIGKPCFYLPPAVDTLRAWPGDRPAPRHIDVYSMGRRSPRTHQALLELADQRGWFYAYDTVRSNEVIEATQHRLLLANTIKRTRFFIANKAKIDVPEQTGGQQEVGYRFFEGAAGGTVMLGEPPTTTTFHDLFGWEDAVIELPYGSDQIAGVIDELQRSPERIANIRARNVRESLRRHDWAYRWRQVLDQVGMSPAAALTARETRLRHLAERTTVSV